MIIRTDSKNKNFIQLVAKLDSELARRDGADHGFYAQFNKIDHIKYAVVLYENQIAVGCGAIKRYKKDVMEIKRMFTLPIYRGQGVASRILKELELWAAELGYNRCILETGIRQPEAIALYQKQGYVRILNYGQYANVKDSVCFEKYLNPEESK
jgi:GNAT superfamily N-acetyltransferase